MASPDQIADPALRARVQSARELIRSGKGGEAVRELAGVFVALLRAKPALMEREIEPRPGRRFPAVMQWPAYGANLTLESVLRRDPEIVFTRERFSTAEAITYLEFTIESIVDSERDE